MMTMQMQSSMAKSMVSSLSSRQSVASAQSIRLSRRQMTVRATGSDPKVPPPSESSTPITPPTPVAPPMPKVVVPKALSFPEAMAFKGAAPEITNGRLAMVGFVAAVFAELSTGTPVAGQLALAPAAIGFTFVLFAFASLVPILKGTKAGAGGKELGGVSSFTAAAELANGRVAMLGFLALLVTEAIKGSAVF